MADDGERGQHGPLAGLRILEYGDLVTAPYAAKILADLGADVLKIEPRQGDRSRDVGPFPSDEPHPERSGLFTYLNAKKRGVTLDLGSTRGRQLLDHLVADADVLIENTEVRDTERLGLSHDRLREVNPHLLHLSVTPFGHNGPYASHRGYGLNVAAMSGVSLATGSREGSPLPLPDFLQDFFTGVVGALGCVLALSDASPREERQGEWIDLSSAETWMTFQMGVGMVSWLFGGRRTLRQGRLNRGGPYPLCILPCADGDIRLIAMTKREWTRFLGVMGDPEWGHEERFQDRVKMNDLYAEELNSLIEPWLGQHTKAELQDKFYEAGVPFMPMKDFGDVFTDEQLRARGFFVAAEQPGLGTLEMPGPPYRFTRAPLSEWRPAPALGQHNTEVYGDEMGLEAAELLALRQAGVI